MLRQVPEYHLGPELGVGAVATVCEVVAADGQRYAGKMLHASRADDPDAAARFAREASVVQSVAHPNVVRVFGRTQVEGRDVLLMELVEGASLGHLLAREAPLSQDRIYALAKGIASGLGAAHDAGVIHRDLKPANILLSQDGVPKVADFGMARASSFEGMDSSAFAVLGTPDYMAPEVLEPLAVDARSDLYALGCIVFEMATGRPPFSAPTSFGVIEQHRTAPIPPIPGAGSGLEALIKALLSKAPADRPQSASAVVEILEALETGNAGRDGPTEALALRGTAAAEVAGRCARCGEPLVQAVRVCLGCRLAVPRVEPGDYTVFITGPGDVADKLDSKLRGDLVDWLRGNATLGVDPDRIAKKIPRLPFALLSEVSQRSGSGLVASLRTLGLEAEALQGGVFALPAMRKKARVLGARVLGIVVASSVGMSGSLMNMGWFMLMYPVAWILVPAVTVLLDARPKLQASTTTTALPPSLSERLERVAVVGEGMGSKRHRETLRGVTSRALALREATHEAGRGEVDAEVARALDLGMVAAGKLDELDAQLAAVDLREPTAEVHALMHARDTWSARVLELVATLDSLQMRLAAAHGQGRASGEQLDRLRATVEALEEVQST